MDCVLQSLFLGKKALRNRRENRSLSRFRAFAKESKQVVLRGWVRWEVSSAPSRICPLLKARLYLQEGLAGRKVSLVFMAAGLGSLPCPNSPRDPWQII